MTTPVESLLTEGLKAGFVKGGTSKEEVWVGPFQVKSSERVILDPETEEVTGHYIDQWTPGRLGGGQELVQVGDERAIRLYAGGTLPEEELIKLGTNHDEIMTYLTDKITALGEQTRLGKPCRPDPDGLWQYAYEILRKDVDGIPVRVSLETIAFKDTTVYAHPLIQSPIEQS